MAKGSITLLVKTSAKQPVAAVGFGTVNDFGQAIAAAMIRSVTAGSGSVRDRRLARNLFLYNV
jgi:hypothetical protein